MDLKSLAERFNRALKHAFYFKQVLTLFIILAISGTLNLFFQLIAAYAPTWLALPLDAIGIFFIIAFVLAGGTFLIQIYDRRMKGESIEFSKLLLNSWELPIKASYLAFPLLIAFFLFWVLLGVFLLLYAIPYVGPFLGIFLSFGPFLLNLATLLLLLLALLLFFFVAPSLALSGRIEHRTILQKVRSDFFTNLLLFVVGLFPVWVVWKFLSGAVALTRATYFVEASAPGRVVQAFFMMLPFVAILTPVVCFFFNFAWEAYNGDQE